MDQEGSFSALQTNGMRETKETNTAAGKIFGWRLEGRKERLYDGDVRLGLTRRKLPTLRYV